MESQSPAIRWLHLSDFHQGAEAQSQSWLWPSAKESFLEDLENQVEARGGIDLVFFTGDLTQSAQPEQFLRLTETLTEIFEALKKLGSSPVLLPVPGNHDLLRPRAGDERDILCSWVQQPVQIQNRFWQEPDGRYRKLVRDAFASYQIWLADWFKRHPPPKNLTLKEGLLTGDFSASFVKQDEGKGEISLLLVGLNSAFLQLSEGDYKAKLEVHPRQFQAVLPVGWKKQHDAALLLTHHPPGWLHSEALEWYRGEIANPDLIAAHMFGHMHEPTYHGVSEGGAAARYAVQAASLFSNEPMGPSGPRTRIHGYSVGELSLSGEKEGQIRVWPRLAVKRSSGVYEFDSDIQTTRGRDQSLRTPHRFPRLRALGATGTRPKPGGSADADPIYARRPHLERPLREYLERRAPLPVVLSGPPHCGRRTLLRRVLAEFKQEEARGGREVNVAWLDFADLPCGRREDLDLLLLGMASELGNKLFGPSKTRQLFDSHRQIHGHTSGLTWLLKEDVLPRTHGTLILAMLSFERMAASPLRDRHPRLMELLRVFAHKLHIVETPSHLANLSDSMLLVDDGSAVIRFHHDHARSKEILLDPEACKPYCRRFEDIWTEGGTPISATVAGL